MAKKEKFNSFVFHARINKQFSLKKLSDYALFKRFKFSPLLSKLELDFKDKLSDFGINIDPKLFGSKNREIYISKKFRMILHAELIRFRPGHSILEITIIYKKKTSLESIKNEFKKIGKLGKIEYGDIIECHRRKKINEKLTKLSPNGKILQNSENQNIFPYLYNSKNRMVVTKIISSFEGIAVPEEVLLSPAKNSKIRPKRISNLLKASPLFTKNYTIICNKCNSPILEINYPNQEKAKRALADGKYYCPRCKSKKGKIIQTFALKDEVIKIIRNSVWLEKYVDEIISKELQDTWPCRMHGNDELDNVLLCRRKLIVVECKDASFGQNQLYTLLAKAENIGADIMVVVTTKKVEGDVITSIERYKETSEREIVLIHGNLKEINRQLTNFIHNLQMDYINTIFKFKRLHNRAVRHHLYLEDSLFL